MRPGREPFVFAAADGPFASNNDPPAATGKVRRNGQHFPLLAIRARASIVSARVAAAACCSASRAAPTEIDASEAWSSASVWYVQLT